MIAAHTANAIVESWAGHKKFSLKALPVKIVPYGAVYLITIERPVQTSFAYRNMEHRPAYYPVDGYAIP